MVCRKNFEVTALALGQNRTFECITWNVKVNKKLLFITDIYNLPSKDRVTNSMFIVNIMDHLTSILPNTKKFDIRRLQHACQ